MDSNITLSGVAVAGMPSSFGVVNVVTPSAYALPKLPAAHDAGAGWPAAAAAVAPQRKRRPAVETGASVDRSLI